MSFDLTPSALRSLTFRRAPEAKASRSPWSHPETPPSGICVCPVGYKPASVRGRRGSFDIRKQAGRISEKGLLLLAIGAPECPVEDHSTALQTQRQSAQLRVSGI